jgi:hypothetical protein
VDLAYIGVVGTRVSDEGLAPFAACKNLEGLSIGDTNVTDRGLMAFKNCKNLKAILLQKSKVTAAGVEEMKQALPQCRIEWDGGAIAPPTSPQRPAP